MSTDRGTDASQSGACSVCHHTPLYCSCGTTSVPPLPGEQSYDNALAEGRRRWPNQPIPGCCGFTRPTGRCCVETDVSSDEEEENDGSE